MNVINQSINGRTLTVKTKQKVSVIGQNHLGKTVVSISENPTLWVELPRTPWLWVEAGFVGWIEANGWCRDLDGTEKGVRL